MYAQRTMQQGAHEKTPEDSFGGLAGCGGQMVGCGGQMVGCGGQMVGCGGQMVGCGGQMVGVKKPRCCRGFARVTGQHQPPACAASRPYVEKSTVLSLQYL